jgi:hypothetical protein
LKIFIRSLFPYDKWGWGTNEEKRFKLKRQLNRLGFYVLTGKDGNSLDVFAVKTKTWIERWFL